MESNETQLAIQDRLLAWFELNKKQILWGAIAVVAAGVVTGFYVSHQNAKELDANEALSKVITAERANAERAQAAEAKSPGAALKVDLDAAADYLKVVADYPNTDAGMRALLLGATSLFTAGKFPEAQQQFEKFVSRYRETPFASQAMYGVAACLGAQGKTNEAAAAFNDILKRFPNDNVASQTKLAVAKLDEAQNKLPQARDLYDELLRTFGNNSLLGSEAGFHLRGLFVKHPELFPARTGPTNTPAMSIGQP